MRADAESHAEEPKPAPKPASATIRPEPQPAKPAEQTHYPELARDLYGCAHKAATVIVTAIILFLWGWLLWWIWTDVLKLPKLQTPPSIVESSGR